MSESDKQTALVPVQPNALTIVGAKSLAARGRTDLRVKEETEEWIKKGLDYHLQRQYDDAFRCFERGIQLNPNHPEIQFMLGFMYSNGHGIPQDCAQAATWYRKAGEQGNAAAQNNLGCYYRDGQGVSRDYAQAIVWFRKATDQNRADAQANLGYLYYYGLGVPQDYEQAAQFNRKAADQGLAQAQYNLGLDYAHGQGVPQDYAQAAVWYRKAGEQGNAPAQYNLGCYYRDGRGVSRDYAQAIVWFRRAIDQNSADAQTGLGSLYYHGQGVPQDYAQALAWFRKAAEQDNAVAQYNLGNSYLCGQGAPQDYAESYFWLELAVSGNLKGSEQTYAITCRDESASHLTSAELSLARERVNKRLNGQIGLSAAFRPLSMARVIELHPDEVEDHPSTPRPSSEEKYPVLSDSEQEATIRGFEATKGDLQIPPHER
jgi:TPR repeat protein